ncbi:hypothetical protein GJ654_11500 [Rhodoblastus acidophilus]|uniref:Glycosyltransferase WbsX n=2 Tax=Rhodoblastus acidophilus TaxID=1074 RepID=A0A6N8DMI0_RHOAC|nr:hypothetical protein [Rhodoblastus acidophilus]MTV31617.1 hypothetical protein [Rhodoblastus acidophilus]
MRNVLEADVHYARAAGIDYFIFGYYLDSGSWGRDANNARALDRAYRAYLALPDRAGVKFALSFNYSFPPQDAPLVSAVISEASRNPDHVRATDGSIPVFFFTPNLAVWVKGLGGEDGAKWVLDDIRRRVREGAGNRLYTVALVFGINAAGPMAQRLGFDAVSTYANGLGGGGRAVPYGACAAGARTFWTAGKRLSIGFLPTVTLGWDYRPLLRDPKEAPRRDPNPSWCEPASDQQWAEQIKAAVDAADSNPRNDRFRSIVLYAWNEFSEGGWIAPTVGEGTRRLEVIRRALGRHRPAARLELSWPRRSPDDVLTADWPCPPDQRIEADKTIAAPTVSDLPMSGDWRIRVCKE